MRIWQLLLPALLLSLAGACTVHVEYSNTRFRCDGDGRCPALQSCVAGFCEPTGTPDAALPDDAAIVDAAPPTDGAAPDRPEIDASTVDAGLPACGKLTLIADDFGDPAVGLEWAQGAYAAAGTTTSETGGRFTITLADNMAGSRWAGYESAHSADLRDAQLSVEVLSVPAATTQATMVFGAFVGPGNDNTLQFVAQGGRLSFTYRINDVETAVADVAYSATAHRFWRFREAAGTTFWETSPDGAAWTQRAARATPISVAVARIVMASGTDRAELAPGTAQYDNLNGGVVAPGLRWCKSSSLSDDFEDALRGQVWARGFASGGCTMVESAGTVAMTPATGMTSACAYASAAMYDLTGSSATIQVPEMLAATSNAYATFYLRTAAGPRIELVQQGGQLGLNRVQVSGTTFTQLALIPYDPVAHRWWRLRESGGTTFWETSPNGMTWTVRASEVVPFALTAVEASFGAGSSATTTAPGTVKFDDYNR